MADGCIFCRIVAGEIPADIVLETDEVIAFRDLNPQAPTHVLVIPREHIVSLDEVGEDHGPLLGSIQVAAARVARAEGLDASGWRLVTNVGAGGGQSVFHLHAHVLGGRDFTWPPG